MDNGIWQGFPNFFLGPVWNENDFTDFFLPNTGVFAIKLN